MTVRVTRLDGTALDYKDKKIGEGTTLDRDDYWAVVTDIGSLNIWKRHLDGSTWNEGGGQHTETTEVVITYGPAGWVSVEGHRENPSLR
ncbi:hypothetical protein [Rhodococcus erythropolis]|uniref:hypothetical protein n=1 Tax=Rhodococcus erythropolis TaxID=1833 RepID=UPI001BE93CB4|nr:hypothetical protein [Rhodococcus erythropolis]MBT2268767.1 hypothetical protein [Rhodococcus erythropolis]